MPTRRVSSLVWVGSALTLALVLGACTPGGMFDPTEVLSSSVFDTKKKLQGEREPLFPDGVPGAETGVPPDLMKGYQPPPEQAADTGDAAATPAPAPVAPKPKPKPKPKPAVARVPAPPHDAAWDQKAGTPTQQQRAQPGQQAAWPAPPQSSPAQTNWPAPPQPAPSAQTNWPAPPQPASAQTNWPPPPTGQGQQTAQPGQSIWPNPPAPGTPAGTYSR
jgi:hypothetical protein